MLISARDLAMQEIVFSVQNKNIKCVHSIQVEGVSMLRHICAFCFEEGYHETAKKRVRRNDIHRNVTA